jgi:hypothetical protein
MPVSMMTMECPCCGRELEVILVGSAHEEMEEAAPPKKRRARRSKTADALDRMGAQLGSVDGGG